MNYQEAIDFLFNSLPMYQREGKAAYKANLDNTLRLDEYFGFPHRQFAPSMWQAQTERDQSATCWHLYFSNPDIKPGSTLHPICLISGNESGSTGQPFLRILSPVLSTKTGTSSRRLFPLFLK